MCIATGSAHCSNRSGRSSSRTSRNSRPIQTDHADGPFRDGRTTPPRQCHVARGMTDAPAGARSSDRRRLEVRRGRRSAGRRDRSSFPAYRRCGTSPRLGSVRPAVDGRHRARAWSSCRTSSSSSRSSASRSRGRAASRLDTARICHDRSSQDRAVPVSPGLDEVDGQAWQPESRPARRSNRGGASSFGADREGATPAPFAQLTPTRSAPPATSDFTPKL